MAFRRSTSSALGGVWARAYPVVSPSMTDASAGTNGLRKHRGKNRFIVPLLLVVDTR